MCSMDNGVVINCGEFHNMECGCGGVVCGGDCCGVIAEREGVSWEGKVASLPTLSIGVAVSGWGDIGVRGKHPCHLEELEGVLAVCGVGV